VHLHPQSALGHLPTCDSNNSENLGRKVYSKSAAPSVTSVDSCPDCGSPVSSSDERCSSCGHHLGFPNVRVASESAERDALTKRYEAAMDRAAARGASEAVASFRAEVAVSSAIVNCDVYRLRELFTEGKSLYSNYHLAVRSQVRKAADIEQDRLRRSVDSLLFGEYAEQIRFGALSIDGNGVRSYGEYSLVLREVAVAKRASLLEENSYSFVVRHDLRPSDPLPAGYRCPWPNRRELAVAKLADLIQSDTPKSDYPRILLSNGATRANDQFVEVHIYGQFNQHSIESVSGSSNPKRPEERAVLASVKELLSKSNKRWIEAA
jgi:hypothetical protein